MKTEKQIQEMIKIHKEGIDTCNNDPHLKWEKKRHIAALETLVWVKN